MASVIPIFEHLAFIFDVAAPVAYQKYKSGISECDVGDELSRAKSPSTDHDLVCQ